jgi:pseudouridine kinase
MINVAVIGTIFVDCKGFARQTYNPLGRNLGEIKFVHGGVGRNVVENLANLGLPTTFISSIDNTAMGEEVRIRLSTANIKLDYLAQTDYCGMGMWLAIMNQSGDLAGSISQMPNLSILENLIENKGSEIVHLCSHVVLELDLNANITRKVIQLCKENKRLVYGIPGNMDVILSNRDILCDLECFICNHVEAGRLMGMNFEELSLDEMQLMLKNYVIETGMKSMVITLGSKGAIYYNISSDELGYQPVVPVEVVDTSGAGDAFFSGTVMGLIEGRPLAEAVIYGTKVAAWTIESDENTCAELSLKSETDAFFYQFKR